MSHVAKTRPALVPLNTHELRVGDIVHLYGMRVHLSREPHIEKRQRVVYAWVGDVLNPEEAIAYGMVPAASSARTDGTRNTAGSGSKPTDGPFRETTWPCGRSSASSPNDLPKPLRGSRGLAFHA